MFVPILRLRRVSKTIKSVHATQLFTSKDGAQDGLKEFNQIQYSATQPSFDPLICSTEVPTSVKYIRQGSQGYGFTSMIAAFGYNGKEPTNLVQYILYLDFANSKSGDWKIISINCHNLDVQTNKPYTPYYDASGRGMDTPLDRTF
jgi:hypothetical protein